jgi:hypothetical protein
MAAVQVVMRLVLDLQSLFLCGDGVLINSLFHYFWASQLLTEAAGSLAIPAGFILLYFPIQF